MASQGLGKAVLPGIVWIINKINKKTGISISQNMAFSEVYDLLYYTAPHICKKIVCEISQEFILLIICVTLSTAWDGYRLGLGEGGWRAR